MHRLGGAKDDAHEGAPLVGPDARTPKGAARARGPGHLELDGELLFGLGSDRRVE